MTGKQSAKITVRVQPNAKRNEVVRFEDSVLYIKIAVLPVKGKANTALFAILSDILGLSKSHLSIERGVTSRTKVIAIEGLTQKEVRERIVNCLA